MNEWIKMMKTNGTHSGDVFWSNEKQIRSFWFIVLKTSVDGKSHSWWNFQVIDCEFFAVAVHNLWLREMCEIHSSDWNGDRVSASGPDSHGFESRNIHKFNFYSEALEWNGASLDKLHDLVSPLSKKKTSRCNSVGKKWMLILIVFVLYAFFVLPRR